MKVDWKQLLTIGRSIAAGFVPGLEASIQAVENVVDAFKPQSGADKKAAAIAAAQSIVFTIEGATGKDILLDPKVVEATGDFVDVYVSMMNAKAQLVAAIEAAKAARNIPTAGVPVTDTAAPSR